MAAHLRLGTTPYALVLTYRERGGELVRATVGRRKSLPAALAEARRGNRAWSLLIGGWYWPPHYTVVDMRDGTEHQPHHYIPGGIHGGTQDTGTDRGTLF